MLLDFLNAVLPEEGYRCAATNPPWEHFFFITNEELAAFIERMQAKKDVYFCTATLTKARRIGENVAFKKALYLDIDGVKEYGTVDAGRSAFEQFLRGSNWPRPSCIVGSGGGLHCYWILDAAIPVEQWREIALSLRAACEQHGLKADHGCTIDCVRVLRSPGSFNHKPSRSCRVDLLTPIGQFYSRLSFSSSTSQRTTAANEYILKHEPTLVPFAAVARQCEQVRHFAETGLAGEKGWWAMAGVFTYIENGDELFHKFSSIDPEYNYAQTQRKLNDRRSHATGPITCERIRTASSRPDLCARCPSFERIVTPVQVGGNGYNSDPSPPAHGHEETGTRECEGGAGVLPRGNLPRLPEQFIWGPNGELNFIGKDNKVGQITVSGGMLFLAGRSRDKLRSEYFDVFEYRDPLEGPQTIRLKSSEVSNSVAVSLMAKHGVSIQSAEYFRLYVARARDMLAKQEKAQVQHDQFGWKDDGFLLGGILHTPEGSAESSISSELRERAIHLRGGGAKGNGDLKAWSSSIRGLLQPGFECQQVALLASAAAPLIKFVNDAEGGALIHFVSRVSGAGKTVALEIAASLWGDYNGLRTTAEDTRSFRAGLFASLGNLPIVFNELVERDPSAVESLVRIFSEGRNKGRCHSDGTPIEDPKRWSTIMLSTANRSLNDLIRSVGGTEAMSARVLEFEMEPIRDSRIMAAGERYMKGAKANCGWAGQELINAYVGLPKGVLEEAVETSYEEILERYPKWGAGSRYRARVLGCLRVGGYFLDRLGLIEFDVERLIKWAGDYLNSPSAEEEVKESAISAFLNEHVSSTLVVDRITHGRNDIAAPLRLPSRDLLIRKEDCEGGMISIDRLTFLKWLSSKDIITSSFIKRLTEDRVIVNPSKMVLLGEGTTLSGGFVQCIVVDPEKI